jgi:glycosyltransferase involved in cell wall biosynthesis
MRVHGGDETVRVAFHTDQLWFAAPGGIGTYVRELLRTLPTLEDPPTLVGFQASGHAIPQMEIPIVEVPGSIRRTYPSWALVGRPPLPPELRDVDVVHATNPAAVPPVGAGQALVVTVHDLAFDVYPQTFPPTWRRLYRAGARAAARRAAMILTPSTATATDLQEHYHVAAERIRVTPLASSLPRGDLDVAAVLDRLGIPRPYLLCPATLEARKNQTRLVRAYRQVAPEVPHALVLAGPDGWRTDALEDQLRTEGPGTVLRTGLLRGDDLDAVIRGADAVAYPSLYEGFGLPIVEAMQRGVPVVTSTAPACVETAGGAAIVVDPEDVGGLADAVATVLTDAEVRDSLISRGRERAEGFSWEATARATLDAYRGALAVVRGSG